MTATRTWAAPALLLSAALTACGSGVPATGRGATSTLPAPATGSASASAKPTGPPPASPSATVDSGPPFVAATATATSPAAPSGKGLSVTDIRSGDQVGFDRVVFVLGGSGTVGWRVRYDADPRRQGSGDPVRLGTAATISVLLEGVSYPMDSGVPEYSGPRRQSPNLPAVRELQLGGVFEGSFDAFIGVDASRPFRVFRLHNPQRVVIDVQR